MMLVLKIPILYLCAVVWWAIKAEPRPLEGAAVTVSAGPDPRPECAGRPVPARRGRPRPRAPRGPDRTRRSALARAEARR